MTPRRLLVVGAGSAGAMAVREMLSAPQAGFLPVAFVDDDPAKRNTRVEGLPVLGDRTDIPRLIRETGADELLIALPSLRGAVIREVIEVCRTERVSFRVVPGIWEIIRGDVHLEQIRPIEAEDLLGRETVEPTGDLMAGAYRGRSVVITGAGGSIGRELARQLLSLGPSALVLIGRGENSLFETDLVLRDAAGPSGCGWELVLADVRDRPTIDRLFARVRPDVVFHAAAHKHVGFLEANPEEAVLNNVIATRDLVDACAAVGVERFVMLSTDKAVYPESMLGATKRLAERLLEERTPRLAKPRLMSVRFGNVLGSRGSVVPLFRHQIRAGGPVTVSHPEAARYFMTVKEAVTLVLEAGAIGAGGEIFILDMGEQILILDLARDLIILSGLRPDEDIRIEITGMKPGEKLREELVHRFEELRPTRSPRIRTAHRTGEDAPAVEPALDTLESMARASDRAGLRRILAGLLPEATLPGTDRGTVGSERRGG